MKYSFNINIGTRHKEENSTVLTLINRHSFMLKTTMLGESVDTTWVSLGSFTSKIKALDNLDNINVYIPEVKQYIESNFGNIIRISLGTKEHKFYKFHELSVHDGQALGDIDGVTLKLMDSNMEEG